MSRDVRSDNLMLDARGLYTERFFPWVGDKTVDLTKPVKPRHTRTEKPPRYYIIDFGFSKQYSPEEMPPSEPPRRGTDFTAPEFIDETIPCNPFPIDVFALGRLILRDFITVRSFPIAISGRPELTSN